MSCSVVNNFRFIEWLARQRTGAGLGKSDLGRKMARAIGREEAFTPGYVNNLETGERKPTGETVCALAAVFEVDPAWLQAQVDIEQLGEARARAIAAQLRGDKAADVLASVPGQVRARDLDAGPFPWEVPSKPAAPPPPVTKRLDVYPVGAFKGRVAVPPVGQVEVPEAEAKGVAYAVRVEGDSMDDLDHPKLQPMPEGTIALVKKKASPAPGDVPGRDRNPLDEQRPEED